MKAKNIRHTLIEVAHAYDVKVGDGMWSLYIKSPRGDHAPKQGRVLAALEAAGRALEAHLGIEPADHEWPAHTFAGGVVTPHLCVACGKPKGEH